jgi:transposase
MGFITGDRSQLGLLGYSIDELVPVDSKCRFITSIIAHLDLRELYNRYSDQGNDAFDPGILLATWFFAYAEGITSTRRLEELCKRDTHYMYVSTLLKPDHTSLSRFRRRHADLLPAYFEQIVAIAIKQGISDFKVISIDGTKLQAASSLRHMKDQKALGRYLEHVRKDIQTYLNECIQSDDPDLALRALETKAQMAEECLGELEQRQLTLKEEHQSGHQINLMEPEACLMHQVNGVRALPAYNAQVGVDTKSHLIVSIEVVSDRNDRRQFSRQHERITHTLGSDPHRAYVADAGYHTKEQLDYIDAHQIQAVIADPTPAYRSTGRIRTEDTGEHSVFTRSDFVYDSESDSYTCPVGEPLRYVEHYRRGAWNGRVYQAKTCLNCPLRSRCMPKAKPYNMKRIRREGREYLAERMAELLQTSYAQKLLSIRRSSVEPVFGNIKSNLRFRRFCMRGLAKASGEFALMAIAHNLNTLFRRLGSTFYSLYTYFRILFSCQRTFLYEYTY